MRGNTHRTAFAWVCFNLTKNNADHATGTPVFVID
jgi:hypothetical protein